MTNQLVKGLEYLTWLSRAQGERLLRCRRTGCACAFRFQPKSGAKGKSRSDVPFLCGFIAADTKCKAVVG